MCAQPTKTDDIFENEDTITSKDSTLHFEGLGPYSKMGNYGASFASRPR